MQTIDWTAKASPMRKGIRINMPSKSALYDAVREKFTTGEGFTIATINLDHTVKLRRDDLFRTAYAAHSHVVADGNPIVWLSHLARRPVELAPGSELIVPLCRIAAEMNVPVAFFGSMDKTLDAAAEALRTEIPGLKIVKTLSPPMGFDPESDAAIEFIDTIEAAGARLCFLALGAPKQEVFAVRASGRLPKTGFVSIGAGLDFIAGSQVRAPIWVRNLALEWMWRLAQNPRRMSKRYAECIMILPALMREALVARSTDADQIAR
ncbi:MAG: WecB/TagA/CpsF family glycosyltransferase [Pseudomonadota bacterium]